MFYHHCCSPCSLFPRVWYDGLVYNVAQTSPLTVGDLVLTFCSIFQTAPLLAFGVNTFKEKARELADSGDYDLRKNMYFSDKWLSTFLRKFNLQVTSLPVDADGEAVLTDANGTSEWNETHVEGVETDDEDGNANNQTDTQNNDSLIKHVQLTDEMRAALVEKRIAEPAWSQLQLANW